MKEMSIEEVQQISLEVLEQVDAFCRRQGLRYWISDGTLIGAIRHQGFIPWDDDLDITMPRPDYERFVRTFEDSEEYRLFSSYRGNSYLTYARVCEMKRSVLVQTNVWSPDKTGVGIDIIPLNGAPDSEAEFMGLFRSTVRILDWLIYCRHILSPVDRAAGAGFTSFVKSSVRTILRVTGSWFVRQLIFRLINCQERLRKRYDFDTSEKCHAMVIYERRPHFWPKAWFAETVEVDFCGKKFPAPRDYDAYLREYYGDYMTPPPVAERESHASRQLAYWR